MAVPQTFSIASFVGANGGIPISWGTLGVFNTAIVVDVSYEMKTNNVEIQNGSGLTVQQVLIYDADEVMMTVVDDRSVSWPTIGGIITMYNPIPNGSTWTSQTYQVLSSDYKAERSKDGHRVLKCKRYNMFAPAAM